MKMKKYFCFNIYRRESGQRERETERESVWLFGIQGRKRGMWEILSADITCVALTQSYMECLFS